ncbi:MAG TPA: DUF4390 domain-containing protein [Candidatus Cryosericum sp.]|nr:DUF4390 domain-containing protein [Candidatus Cryosericum sp.]
MKRILLAAAVVLASAASQAVAGSPSLNGLAVSRQGDDLLASCQLVDGLSASMLEEIEAGIETTLDYRLQLYRRRSGLPDDSVARRLVVCSVRHDALTRQYTLTRRVDGELVETRVTPEAAEMRAFLTTLKNVPIARAPDLISGEEYYLRARCDLGLVWRFYLIPWRLDTGWARVDLAPATEKAVESRR